MPPEMLSTLLSSGLPGIVIIGLCIGLRTLYKKNEELTSILLDLTKSSTQTITQQTIIMEQHTEVLKEVNDFLKEKRDAR